jgi:hypothetical protein
MKCSIEGCNEEAIGEVENLLMCFDSKKCWLCSMFHPNSVSYKTSGMIIEPKPKKPPIVIPPCCIEAEVLRAIMEMYIDGVAVDSIAGMVGLDTYTVNGVIDEFIV